MFCATIYRTNRVNETRISATRREIFIWAMAVLFLNHLFSIFFGQAFKLFGELSAIGIFQCMAWYAIFYLLGSSETRSPPLLPDLVVMPALCLLVLLPTSRMIWVSAAGIAIYLLIMHRGDSKLLAAGAVLGALAVQQFWGHVVFNLVAFPLLRAETAVVGTILEATRPGTVWQDNIITGPSGFGLVIHTACSSYHNLSLAVLCWITVSKLHDQRWRRHDLIMGSVVSVTMIILNLVRLCLMAPDIDRYDYWHEGTGAVIFAIGASLTIFSISLYGSLRRGS